MDTLRAHEQLPADAGMSDIAIEEDGSGNGDCSLRVVGGLTDQPLALPIARVPRNDRPGMTLESVKSARVPMGNAVASQILCLLADSVPGRQSLQGCENSAELWHQVIRLGNTTE